MSRIISKRSLKLLVSLKSLLASPPTPPRPYENKPLHFKMVFDHFSYFLSPEGMTGSVVCEMSNPIMAGFSQDMWSRQR